MSYEKAAITTALKIMRDLDDSEGALVCKDCSSSRIKTYVGSNGSDPSLHPEGNQDSCCQLTE